MFETRQSVLKFKNKNLIDIPIRLIHRNSRLIRGVTVVYKIEKLSNLVINKIINEIKCNRRQTCSLTVPPSYKLTSQAKKALKSTTLKCWR